MWNRLGVESMLLNLIIKHLVNLVQVRRRNIMQMKLITITLMPSILLKLKVIHTAAVIAVHSVNSD